MGHIHIHTARRLTVPRFSCYVIYLFLLGHLTFDTPFLLFSHKFSHFFVPIRGSPFQTRRSMSDDEEAPQHTTDKTDTERVGFFQDGPFDTSVTLYRPDNLTIFGRDPNFGRDDDPLRLGGPFPMGIGYKLKAATNDWPFSPFMYLYEEGKDEWEPVGSWAKKYKKEREEKVLDPEHPFISTFGSKMMNGLGTLYGTFITDFEASSPLADLKEDERLKGIANFLVNFPKKGTGYGYSDVGLSPYPEHMDDPMFDLYEARKEMREAFEAALLDRAWIPKANSDFFDPNPYFDSKDPDGTTETYDWSRLVSQAALVESFLAGPWIPSNYTKKINGNKDVVSPLEKFPSHDPVDPYEDPPLQIFRRYAKKDDQTPWKGQLSVNDSLRTYRLHYQRSTMLYNIRLEVNPMTFHCY